jgi:hypothetical protein
MGLFLYVGYIVLTTHSVPETPVQTFRNWQEADAPYGYPVGEDKKPQKFHPLMHLHSPFEMAEIPTTPRMDHAMGSEHGALTYNAQKFGEMNPKRGGQHMGDDVNGIGGQNSDFGDPVYAVGNGLVVYAGSPSPGWGNTVILAHRMPDGRILHSMYSHLHEIFVALHSHVGRGKQIGTVGSAKGRYLAHLHLEMRHTDGLSNQAGYSMHPFDRLDPESVIEANRNAPDDQLTPSVLEILKRTKLQQLPEMDAESALKLQEFFQRSEPSR